MKLKRDLHGLMPWPGHILVRQHKTGETTEGGVILPTNAQKNLNQGTVLAVGEPLKDNPYPPGLLDALPGRVVFWLGYMGTGITVNNEEIFILEFRDILASHSIPEEASDADIE